ncbi:MAG: cupredoxin family copper-binding protein [Caldilineaceae bacterium]
MVRNKSKNKLAGLIIAALLIFSLLLAACQMPAPIMLEEPAAHMAGITDAEDAEQDAMTDTMTADMAHESMPSPHMVMTAVDLRVTLDQLLGEHVLLASSATAAALGGNPAEFEAAANALDMNSMDLAGAIGLVYGADAESAFLALWRTHIGFFVDYTTATAADDDLGKKAALDALDGYAEDFGAFLEAANPNLPKAAVAGALGPHVSTLTAAIDAQAAGDAEMAYAHLREAYAHMDMIAKALAGAISAQFPERFPGDAHAAAADLGVRLNMLLAEHTYLAAMATSAAISERHSEIEAAAMALDANSIDLAAAVGSVYGADAGGAFLALWRTHIGFFVDYTEGAAMRNEAKKQEALAALTGYAADFGAFLEAANPNLPQAAVAEALVPHVATLTAVIDAQAAGDYPTAYMHLREAYAHMRMIADALTHAIVMQFPELFDMAEMDMGADANMMDHADMAGTADMNSMDHMNDMADIEAEEPAAASMVMTAGALRAKLDLLLGEHVLLASSATDAALRGRQAEFEAAANVLDGNSMDIAALIGTVYGPDAQEAFLSLWRTHIGFFVDYTAGLATGDQAMQNKALADLDGYAEDFGAFMEAANPFLPQATVAAALRSHVKTLVAVIDAQAAFTPQESGDQQMAYAALRMAYAHMDMEATAIAGALSQQFPALFPGAVDSAEANVRSALNMVLAEHAFLVIKSADAAIQSRNIEYEAAAAALDANSVDLANAVGSVYGDEAGDAFLALWRKHIGFFADYELAAIEGNQARQDAALENLVGYASDFAAFLSSANPLLPADGVTELVGLHAGMSLDAIDAASQLDYVQMYASLRASYGHMQIIANPLTDAIAGQFPDLFPAAMMDEMTMTAPPAADEAMPMSADAMADAPANTVELTIDTFIFSPQVVEVPVGTTIIWTNMDAIDHTVTAGAPDAETGVFDSGFFNQGERFAFTFTEVGEYAYFCKRHPNMRGMVVVVEQ